MLEYYARPEQLLSDHENEVALGCSLRAGKIGLSLTGLVLGLVHDWGKYSEDFVRYMDKIINDTGHAVRGSVDHSTAGAQFIWRNFPLEDSGAGMIFRQIMALCCASHHEGCLINCLGPDGEAVFEDRINKEDEKTHYEEVCARVSLERREEVIRILNSDEFRDERERFHGRLVRLNTNGTVLNEKRLYFQYGLAARYLLSCLVDADHSSAGGAEKNKVEQHPDWSGMVSGLQEHISSLKSRGLIDDLRTEIGQKCRAQVERERQLFLLTLPTGGGKTFASLAFALTHAQIHDLDRIIYVIPYTSIIDQNAEAVRKALGDRFAGEILEHHSNVLLDPEAGKKQGRDQYWTEDSYKKATDTWDVPIVLTTTVQFLNTCFSKGSSGTRRFNALARSVIIFDEVQALPITSIYLFNGMVNFLTEHMGASVVLCTATQPVLDQLEHEVGCLRLPDAPHIVDDYAGYYEKFAELKKIKLRDLPESEEWNAEEHADFILKTAREKGNTLVIVNTKAWARDLYQRCLSDEFEVYHLSTAMCPAHRKKIIAEKISKEALNREDREKKVICISTQLIEAGVDVDFDVVIRSCAGLDSVVQAAGRCNRDSRQEQGEVIILHPGKKCEKTGSLKEINAGREILQRLLSDYDNEAQCLLSEEAMKYYFGYYLHEFSEKMEYHVTVKDVGTTLMNLLTRNHHARCGYELNRKHPSQDFLCQSFKSAAENYEAIADSTVSILTPYGKGRQIIESLQTVSREREKNWDEIRRLLREAQQYSISLWDDGNTLMELENSGIVYKSSSELDFYFLTSGYYDDEMGFLQNNDKTFGVMNCSGHTI